MGLAIAEKALANNAIVHLASSNPEKLKQAADHLSRVGTVITHALDISKESEVITLSKKLGSIDHLVTTAARLSFKSLFDLTATEIGEMIDSKLWGPILLTKYLAPKMPPDGSITYFSGVAADKGGPDSSIVGAVNSALHGLAKNLVYEVTPVRINVVSPGVVQTPTWDFISDSNQKNFFEKVSAGLPAKRIGQAVDLAEAALFLMTNKYVNGTILTVDGGANA